MLRTFHASLCGNPGKMRLLQALHRRVQELSAHLFHHTDFRSAKFSAGLYAELRARFPDLHSKLIQKAMREYGKFGKAKPPRKPIYLPIIWDYQQFNHRFHPGHFGVWIRFLKTNFAVQGRRTVKQLLEANKIQEIRIQRCARKCWRIYFVCDMPEPEAVQTGLAVGLDANVRCVALSCNKFFNLRPLVHRKQEHRKGKGKPNLRNYTRDFLWKLSQAAVDFLSQQGAEVLRLENLTGLRKNRTEKHGSERERELRFILNNCYPYALLQWMLECRCVQAGIRVQYVDPRNTSKRCSRCGSLRTARPSQSRFVCGDCVWQLNAELNGARNIARGNAWGDGERIDIPHGAQNPLPVEVDAVHEIQPQESAGFFRLQADPPRGGNPCGVSIAL